MIETTYVCRQCGAEDHDWSDSKAAAPMVLNCWKCHSGLQKPIEEMLAGRNIDGPISVRLIAFFRRPKAHYRKTGLRGDAPKFHTSKPDTDNLAKAVLDALTVIGSWGDDAQVANLYVEKRYGERAGVSAEVTVLEDPLP